MTDLAGRLTHKCLIHCVGDDVGVAVADVENGQQVIAVYMDTEDSVKLVAKTTCRSATRSL